MRYTLLTAEGRVMRFYVKSVGELYLSLYGGALFSEAILVEEALDNSRAIV
jgi:hypothetical protein